MIETFEWISTDTGGKFELFYSGEKAGEISFQWEGPNQMAIDHTEVFEGFSGKGIGKKLVKYSVDFAREKGCLIKTICPFAAKVFDETEAYKAIQYY